MLNERQLVTQHSALGISSNAQQHFHRQLIQLLVAETAAGERDAVDVLG
jgi:hypothetical protein